MQYKKLRNAYKPDSIRAVFVLESPPKSGKFFYNPEGKTTESLFKAMMELIGYAPKDQQKQDGLKEFKSRGLIIVDAIYMPVNGMKKKERNNRIIGKYKVLLQDLNALIPGKRTPLILVKANICRLLEKRLKKDGFTVANEGIVVYFPSGRQQGKFRKQIASVLNKSGIKVS
ncbi:MAG: hypothetical protein V2A65_07955 [Candidatus Omnitrophota bacterium]